MISVSRSKNGRRSVIFGRAFRLILFAGLIFATSAFAQEKSWEMSLTISSFNIYYQENFKNTEDGDPQDIQGNTWDAIQLRPVVTYRARQELNLPFFLTIEANIPIVTISRL